VNPDGHLELRWAVEAIRVGTRARQDIGDVTALVDSIRQHGLLQPLTLSPDGTLLCGARRLVALQHLGVTHTQVWIRPGLSTRLQRLFAEQDENTLHQPLRPTEAAALYREVKQLLTEDAARRQEASRFGAERPDHSRGSGDANLASPVRGATRAHAARLITGAKSYTTLERVDELRRIADDLRQPGTSRDAALIALHRMDQDGRVWGHYRHAKAVQATGRADDPELPALARRARQRAAPPDQRQQRPNVSPSLSGAGATVGPTAHEGAPVRPATLRAFLLLCDELSSWPTRFDPTVIGPALPDHRWDTLSASIDAGGAFFRAAHQARTTAQATGDPRGSQRSD
jgi:ParB family chromosome partitioning protein